MGIFGRAVELSTIVDMLSGPEQALAIIGESGIGKSALLSAVYKSTGRIVLVSATAHESKWPFAGLHMILDQSGSQHLGETVRQHKVTKGESSHFELAALIVRSLRDSNPSPMLLLIDNAELLDDDSKQVIGSIIRRIRGSNLRIVLAMASNAPQGPFSGIQELRLAPLSLKDSTALANEISPSGSDLGFLRVVANFSGGVPATIVELVGTMNKNSLDGTDPLTLPLHVSASASEVALRRLPQLGDTAQLQMQLLSCSHKTPLEAIQWLFPEGTTTLEELIAAGFVRSSGAMLHIHSPRLRSVLYWSMAPNERTAAHMRLSEVLRMSHYAAHLWHESFVNPTADLASQLKKVALEHFAQGSIQSGFEALERSRSLAEDDAQDWLLFQEASSILMSHGELSYAARYEQAMLNAGPMRPNPTQVMLGLRLDFLVHETVSVTRCEALARSHGSTHLPEVAHVFSTAAYYLAELGDKSAARLLYDRALSMGPPAGSHARAMCQVVKYLLAMPGIHQPRKPPNVQEFLAEISILGSGNSRILLARILSLAEDYGLARELLDSVPLRGLNTTVLEYSLAKLGKVENEYRSGEHSAAMLEAKQFSDMDLDPHLLAQSNAVIEVWHCGFLGQYLQQALAIDVVQALASPTGGQVVSAGFHAILGRSYLEQGRYPEALIHLERGRELSAAWPNPLDLRIEPDLVEAHVRLNAPRKARRVFQELVQGCELRPSRWSRIVLSRCHALILEGAPSLEAFQVAEDSWSKGDSEYERTRTLRAYAQRLNELGEHEKANLKNPSYALTLSRGTLVATKPHIELVPPVDPRGTILGMLSEAHREVVELALDGLKNREIANQIHLTIRGVESRLAGSYEQLGVTNRTQLFAMFSTSNPRVGT